MAINFLSKLFGGGDERAFPDYGRERRHWKALLANEARAAATATVTKLERDEYQLTEAGRYGNNEVAGVTLSVSFADALGKEQNRTFPMLIEVDLLARFLPGAVVEVLYDPDRPEVIAIHSERTPIEIPS